MGQKVPTEVTTFDKELIEKFSVYSDDSVEKWEQEKVGKLQKIVEYLDSQSMRSPEIANLL